jgi:excisionase family DNA binding protein
MGWPRMATVTKPHYLTLAEAAKLIGVTPDALRQAANRRSLEVEKYGKVWLVTRKALDEYASRPTRSLRDPRKRKQTGDET